MINMTLSKNKIKYIQSLKDKKRRMEYGTFVAEGKKIVSDLLVSCQCQFIAVLPEMLNEFAYLNDRGIEIITASEEELKKASFLKTAPPVIGVFYQPKNDFSVVDLKNNIHLVLDGIQDPGNMGTIVRIADWFGIENIFCSPDTVDIYLPKTVQSTMGAIARVKVHYIDLNIFLKNNSDLPIYGTFLDGEDIYKTNLSENGLIVMGNEGSGIRSYVEKWVNRRLFIPNYPALRTTSESLNVAAATAIVCSEFRRRE